MKTNHSESAPGADQNTPTVTVLAGDAVQMLASHSIEPVHAVITDPPYGLTTHTDIAEILSSWLQGHTYCSGQSGYAGNTWDNSVPGPELWRQVGNLLMPGGFIAAFSAARTQHLTATALALAGFEIRDTLHWTYGTGVLRQRDLGTVVREQSKDTHLAELLDGQRAGFKPAHEPIVIARQHITEDTLTENVAKFKVGAIRHARTLNTNSVVTHESGCTSKSCMDNCAVTAKKCGSGTTHLYPGRELPHPSLPVSKPGRSERPVSNDGTSHDTVKPLTLMRWLIRALTPPGGVVLDPFLGSGTTAEAAVLEGRRAIGCELSTEYLPLIEQRLRRVNADYCIRKATS